MVELLPFLPVVLLLVLREGKDIFNLLELDSMVQMKDHLPEVHLDFLELDSMEHKVTDVSPDLINT